MSRYKREIDAQCCNQWMNGIRTINGQYPDDNRDFDINAGSGIKIVPATAGITIINDAAPQSFIAGDNIVITPSGDNLVISLANNVVRAGTTNLTGDVTITGNITQNGSAYETHAEKVYTTDDYIIMRDGATGGLATGDYSGFQVKLYDSMNDGRLVIDNAGTARVGDVGDEQPLLTREESADLDDGALFKWDAANSKAISEGTVGDDTHPLKSVNGVLTPVTNALQTALSPSAVQNATRDSGNTTSGNIKYATYGKVVTGIFDLAISNSSTWSIVLIGSGLPIPVLADLYTFSVDSGYAAGWVAIDNQGRMNLYIRGTALNGQSIRGSFAYIAQ